MAPTSHCSADDGASWQAFERALHQHLEEVGGTPELMRNLSESLRPIFGLVGGPAAFSGSPEEVAASIEAWVGRCREELLGQIVLREIELFQLRGQATS